MIDDPIWEERKVFKSHCIPKIRYERENYANLLRKNSKCCYFLEKRTKAMEKHSKEEDKIFDETIPVDVKLRSIANRLKEPVYDMEEMFKLSQIVRRELCKTSGSPTALIVDLGFIPILAGMLSFEDERLWVEVTWALSNIAGSDEDYTKQLRSAGVVEKLLYLAKIVSCSEVKEQALCGLSNIAAENDEARAELQEGEIVWILLEIFSGGVIKLIVLRAASWLFCNLCKGKLPPPTLLICTLVPLLNRILLVEDLGVQSDLLFSLSHISDHDYTELIMSDIDIRVIIGFAKLKLSQISIPALQILGNCCAKSDVNIEIIISSGFLDAAKIILSGSDSEILHECCWVLTNIASGLPAHVRSIISANLDTTLKNLFESSADFLVRREAALALSNCCCNGKREEGLDLVKHGTLRCLTNTLEIADVTLLLFALSAIDKLLAWGESLESDDYIAREFEMMGGLQNVEKLQLCQNSNVYHTALNILNRYYELSEISKSELQIIK